MAATTPDFDMDDYQFPLPGFRFHPTDEELVDYYLRRKVEKKSVALELIKQIDIYRHNPWDLPYGEGAVGEKECYVFVKRGRKYKNSVRPNRVTGSGFWKATGIDKPIYSQGGGQGSRCIGLKKTLVYYRGSAGRGIKTEWMMHEFRLPPNTASSSSTINSHFAKTKSNAHQEAEIWTLCRIFKRSVSCRKYSTPNWKEIPAANNNGREAMAKSKTYCSSNTMAEFYDNGDQLRATNYISFSSAPSFNGNYYFEDKMKPLVNYCDKTNNQWEEFTMMNSTSSQPAEVESVSPPLSVSQSPDSSGFDEEPTDLFGGSENENWDELRSIVEFAFDPFFE